MTTADDVLAFWFGPAATSREELGLKLKRWYMGGEAEDRRISEGFSADVDRAIAGELDAWAGSPRGRLALVLLLDQMTRSIFRGQARAFAGDAKARALVKEALDTSADASMSFEERQFLLMPLLHSENVVDVERAGVELKRNVDEAPEWARQMLGAGVEQAAKYVGVLRQFGRYPHRNAAMGRESTPAEVEFLKDWAAKQPPAKLTAELSSK